LRQSGDDPQKGIKMQAASSSEVLDRKRLAAVLALMDSDRPGERQAAAEAAHRMVRAATVTWADVVNPPSRPPPLPPPSPRWRDLVAICRSRRELLTPWEARFVATVSAHRRISPKQLAILTELAERVRA
jgi:hypothetical protein